MVVRKNAIEFQNNFMDVGKTSFYFICAQLIKESRFIHMLTKKCTLTFNLLAAFTVNNILSNSFELTYKTMFSKKNS